MTFSEAPDPGALARTELIRLRAKMVRIAHEVEAAADGVTGKRAHAARERLGGLARRIRDAAMSEGAVKASRR